MLSVDGVNKLVDVVIVDPIQNDLVSRATISRGVITIIATRAK